MPLDVMMPFYGRFDHLRVAVESVLAQTSPDWRLVVVDDRYPDEAPGRWLTSLDHPRVSYLRNDENLGVSGNFRRSADLMTAEYGVIMGCDDAMRPRYVERVLELVDRHPDTSIIQPGVAVIDETGRMTRPLADRVKALYRPGGRGARLLSGEPLATSLLRADWAYFPSLVWRSTLIQEIGFRLDLGVVQDLAMLVEIVSRGASMVLDDEVVFDYRRHASSVSAQTGPDGSKFAEERLVFRESAALMRKKGWRRAERAARHHWASRLAALAEVPGAIRASDAAGRTALIAHAVGRH